MEGENEFNLTEEGRRKPVYTLFDKLRSGVSCLRALGRGGKSVVYCRKSTSLKIQGHVRLVYVSTQDRALKTSREKEKKSTY